MANQTVTFTTTKRVTALCDLTQEYSVSAIRVQEVMEESQNALSKEDAIGYLLKNGECELLSTDTELDEVTMVHDTEINV